RLPCEELYMPPIIIKVIDNRQFGRKPVVGQCTIRSLEEYRRTEGEERAEEDGEEDGWRRETPTLTSGEVFIDIDDQEPLVPDQFADGASSAIINLSTSSSSLHVGNILIL
ncbi:hypothetical protein ILYODFUR_020874, partial [Ilyodon furcidens]